MEKENSKKSGLHILLSEIRTSFKNPPKGNEHTTEEKWALGLMAIHAGPIVFFAFYIPLFLNGDTYYKARYLLTVSTIFGGITFVVIPLIFVLLAWKKIHNIRKASYIIFAVLVLWLMHKDVIDMFKDIRHFNQYGAEIIEGEVIKSSDGIRGAYYNIYLDTFEQSLTAGWGPNLEVGTKYRIYYLPHTREIISAIRPGQRYNFERPVPEKIEIQDFSLDQEKVNDLLESLEDN